MKLFKGQKVNTHLGTGTVLGFEVFNSKGFSLPLSDVDPEDGCRVVVQLHDPRQWVATRQTEHPYLFRRDIKKALD